MKRAAVVTGGASGIGLSICVHLAPMVAGAAAGAVAFSEAMASRVPVGRGRQAS